MFSKNKHNVHVSVNISGYLHVIINKNIELSKEVLFKNLLIIITKHPWQLTIKHLMTGPEGNSEFCFQRISMFPETKSRETLRFEGKKIHCSPRDLSH